MEHLPVRGLTSGFPPAHLNPVPQGTQGKSAWLMDRPGGMQGGLRSRERFDLVNQITWMCFSRAYPCRLLLSPEANAWSHAVDHSVSDLGSDAFSELIPL